MIYLLRHGRDDEDFLGGWSDNKLTSKGKKQIKEAALHAKFTALMDKFYLSSCPDCAAIMKELRELSL